MSAISRPSILILPDESSTKRRSATTRELLPDPVRPTIPETNPQNISQISAFVRQGWKACVPILIMISWCLFTVSANISVKWKVSSSYHYICHATNFNLQSISTSSILPMIQANEGDEDTRLIEKQGINKVKNMDPTKICILSYVHIFNILRVRRLHLLECDTLWCSSYCEDGGKKFLWNTGNDLLHYAASYPRRL